MEGLKQGQAALLNTKPFMFIFTFTNHNAGFPFRSASTVVAVHAPPSHANYNNRRTITGHIRHDQKAYLQDGFEILGINHLVTNFVLHHLRRSWWADSAPG
jgi:hypothetical protein